MQTIDSTPDIAAASRKEILAWAMYDFANSGYTTVVLTVLFNVYFVGVIAADVSGSATAWWTLTIAASNAMVLLFAPLVGAIADQYAIKKKFLVLTTLGCVTATALLSQAGPGDLWLAIMLIIFSNLMFGIGESIIAAFIPELTTVERSGRLSGFGWAIGYAGGLLVLALCLAYVFSVEKTGQTIHQGVHGSMLITAGCFLVAAMPTLIWLRERAVPQGGDRLHWLHSGYSRLKRTLTRLPHLPDLKRFMIALIVFNSGIYTVIILAGIYANQVLGYSQTEVIKLVIYVNISAAIGAYVFGHLQDRIGAINSLVITLLLWIVSITSLLFSNTPMVFDIAANLIGIALGAAQAIGRALMSCFTPPNRQAEFFGLWGLAVKLSAIIGPATYAFMITVSNSHVPALIVTLSFFVIGLFLLKGINVQRGHEEAKSVY